MNESRTSLEIIAPSIEEAIAKGLEDLGLTQEEVEVEVLDPGSRGLFGLGSRQARVRLKIRSEGDSDLEPDLLIVEGSAEGEQFEEIDLEVEFAAPEQSYGRELAGEEDLEAEIAQAVVEDLLTKMHVRASVSARMGEKDEERGRAALYVNVSGNDLSILIGPHAETLDALQYITGLILAKELGRSVPVVLDVQGFRARREQQLRQLARRMADQAIKTGRRQVLEPMPASERRLIHIELRDHPEVFTESIGEDPHRKVTIVPKP
jgi:spoIIIJ-associated protein